MWNCNLCGNQTDEYVFSNMCSKCEQIRKIIDLYSVDKVLGTLRFVYLRDEYDKVEKREQKQCEDLDKNKEEHKMELRNKKK